MFHPSFFLSELTMLYPSISLRKTGIKPTYSEEEFTCKNIYSLSVNKLLFI
jgi:hypothetical protein